MKLVVGISRIGRGKDCVLVTCSLDTWLNNALCLIVVFDTMQIRPVWGQNAFFVDLDFVAAGSLRRYCRRILFSSFSGKKYPDRSSKRIPGRILQTRFQHHMQKHSENS